VAPGNVRIKMLTLPKNEIPDQTPPSKETSDLGLHFSATKFSLNIRVTESQI